MRAATGSYPNQMQIAEENGKRQVTCHCEWFCRVNATEPKKARESFGQNAQLGCLQLTHVYRDNYMNKN